MSYNFSWSLHPGIGAVHQKKTFLKREAKKKKSDITVTKWTWEAFNKKGFEHMMGESQV